MVSARAGERPIGRPDVPTLKGGPDTALPLRAVASRAQASAWEYDAATPPTPSTASSNATDVMRGRNRTPRGVVALPVRPLAGIRVPQPCYAPLHARQASLADA